MNRQPLPHSTGDHDHQGRIRPMTRQNKAHRPGLRSVDAGPNSPPSWRATSAPPAQAEDIARALEGRPPRAPEPHFRTHFQARRLPGQNVLRRLGIQLHEQSSVGVHYDRIRTEQTSQIEVAGLRISIDQTANTIYLYHVTEARIDGHRGAPGHYRTGRSSSRVSVGR